VKPVACASPGCGGSVFYFVRPAYEWRRVFLWWLFWRGIHLRRYHVGDCVVCTSCDIGQVHAEDGSFLTRKSQELLRAQGELQRNVNPALPPNLTGPPVPAGTGKREMIRPTVVPA